MQIFHKIYYALYVKPTSLSELGNCEGEGGGNLTLLIPRF